MVARVNVRFAVILAAVLVLTAGLGAGLLWFVWTRSASRYADLGDAAMARGDYKAADRFYSRAVAKERTNVRYLTGWLAALDRKVPESETEHLNDYRMYVGVLHNLALVQRPAVEPQRRYLEALYAERLAFPAGRDAWEAFLQNVDAALGGYTGDPPVALRRYRGLAVQALSQAMGQAMNPSLLAAGRADLEATLAEDPGDVWAAWALARMIRDQALRARERGERQAFEEQMALARATLAHAAAHSPGAGGLIALLALDVADADLVGPEAGGARRPALEALRPRLEEAASALMQDAASSGPQAALMLAQFAGAAMRIAGPDGLALADRVLESRLARTPDDADLLLARGRLAAMRGEWDAAIEMLGRVLQLPNRPVSLAGIRLYSQRRQARFEQASAAATVAIRTAVEASRAAQGPDREAAQRAADAALKRAEQFRRELSIDFPEDSPFVKFVEGKLRYVRGDLLGAQAMLTQFVNAAEGADQGAEAMMLLAEICMQLNPPQPGLARDYLRRVHARMPDSVQIRLALAQAEAMLANRDEAIAHYQRVLEMEPGNERAREQLALLQGRVDDPVLQVLVEADRLSQGTRGTLGDDRAALAVIEQALPRHGYDLRLVSAAVRLRLVLGEREEARRVVAAARERHPDSAPLHDLERQLEAGGSLEAALAFIEESDTSAVDKALARHRTYVAYGKTAEADAALADAARLAPDDPRVLELQFLAALSRQAWSAAEALADRAARLDADRAEGDTFRARLHIVRGNLREAVALLQRTVQRGNAAPAVYRLLGVTLLELGRSAEALAALQRAVEINPSDLAAVRSCVAAFAQTGQKPEALAMARRYEALARRDPEFVNMWLALEADAGNLQFARMRREEMLMRRPGDLDNAAALIEIYLNEREWDKARALLDRFRAGAQTGDTAAQTRLAVLDVRYHVDRGNVPEASEVMRRYIETVPREQVSSAYMAFGGFFLRRGVVNLGLAALRQAVATQPEGTHVAELLLGDALLAHGQFAEAEPIFRTLSERPGAGPDVRKRLVEALIQQSKLSEAEAELARMGAAVADDVELLAQQAHVLRGLGRVREARQVLDHACARFPDEPLPYYRRARLLLTDPAYQADALADLDAAIRVRPGYWQALRTRAQVYLKQNREEDALRDLRAAVDAAPGVDDLRWELVDLLLARGQEADAMAVAEAGSRLKSNDLRYLSQAADRFAQAKRWLRAAEFYRRIHAQTGDTASLTAAVLAYLDSQPPNIAAAEALLNASGTKVEESWQLLMARAAVRKRQGRDQAAKDDIMVAFERCLDAPTLGAWFERLRRTLDLRGTLEMLDMVRPGPEAAEWMPLFRAMAMLDDQPPARLQAMTQLGELLERSRNADVRLAACRALTTVLSREQRWREAVEVGRRGLELAPEDVVLNNNVAYMLAEYLRQPEEALPYAQRAVAKAPRSASVAETLASVYWHLGQRVQAIETLQRGLTFPGPDAEIAVLRLRLADWQLQMGDRPGAQAQVELVRDMLTDNAGLTATIRDELARVQRAIEEWRPGPLP